MKLHKSISTTTYLLLFTTLLSCTGGKAKDLKQKEVEVLPADIVELRDDQIKLANIELGTIEWRALNNTIKANGTVNVAPQHLATVCMPLGGFVSKINLATGNTVRKGTVLAILQNQEFIDIQQNYLEAKNKLEYTQAEHQRHNDLYKDDVYSQKSVQQVTSEYKSLKTQVKALEQKLALIGINPAKLNENNISSSVAVVSPISGYVKAVNINIGKYVSSTDVLFEIINSENLFLELTLFEKDADQVSIGQKIRFFINNEAEQHDAIIYQTSKTINANQTYTVFAKIEGVCKNTFPGMYVNAIIETSGKKVTTLPSDAVVRFDDKEYIFVFEKNKRESGKSFTEFRMVQITVGVTEDGYSEIILPAAIDSKAARIVVKGAYKLLSAKKNAGEMSCG